ncbi:hypothetical protein NKR23_g1031 [Pleurostoma richardsiae]|uniref:Uncharacterized protein n=1 Tax=Pleurostoma richardsiae TaxID=41990 RepID=A0AA38RQL2_9PEZI|nr:hypothetical protein NKR23_g1031 [Pleurostoma richardsiae]
MDPIQAQQQQHPQQAAASAAAAAARQQNRQIVLDAQRFERLETNVSKLLELTQLMLNRQEELNDRAQARVQSLEQSVAYAEERLQMAMDGGDLTGMTGGGGAGASSGEEEDGDDDGDDDREPADMAYPPPGMQFRPNFGAKKPLEGLLDNVNMWAKEHGYKVATLRSTQKPGERVRVAVRCALGGEARYKIVQDGQTLIRTKNGQLRKPYRKRTSKKTGCPFGFILGETGQGTGVFEVRYHPHGCLPHNHEAMDV